MISKTRTFLALPASHKRVFIKIALLAPLVEIGIKILKFKRTFGVLKFFVSENESNTPKNERQIVYRYRNYLYLYQKQFFSIGKCLAHSLVLWFLLAKKGIETDLRFGMKKQDKKLLAHSWLEYKRESLISESETDENYVPFSESILSKIAK